MLTLITTDSGTRPALTKNPRKSCRADEVKEFALYHARGFSSFEERRAYLERLEEKYVDGLKGKTNQRIKKENATGINKALDILRDLEDDRRLVEHLKTLSPEECSKYAEAVLGYMVSKERGAAMIRELPFATAAKLFEGRPEAAKNAKILLLLPLEVNIGILRNLQDDDCVALLCMMESISQERHDAIVKLLPPEKRSAILSRYMEIIPVSSFPGIIEGLLGGLSPEKQMKTIGELAPDRQKRIFEALGFAVKQVADCPEQHESILSQPKKSAPAAFSAPRIFLRECGKRSNQEARALFEDVAGILRREREEGSNGNLAIRDRRVTLPKSGKAIIAGDIHGDFSSLIEILERSDFIGRATRGEEVYLVMLGDYIDRGAEEPAVMEAIAFLKKTFPGNVALLMGNHEQMALEELDMIRNSPPTNWGRPGETIQYVPHSSKNEPYEPLLRELPIAVVSQNGIFAVHGGVPEGAEATVDIRKPSKRFETGLLWNDGTESIAEFGPNRRGAGVKKFGRDALDRFLEINHAAVLIHGHEHTAAGVRLQFDNRVATICSWPYSESGKRAYAEIDLSINITTLNSPGVKFAVF